MKTKPVWAIVDDKKQFVSITDSREDNKGKNFTTVALAFYPNMIEAERMKRYILTYNPEEIIEVVKIEPTICDVPAEQKPTE